MKKLIQIYKDKKSLIIQFIKFGIIGLSNTLIAYVVYAFLVFINLHYFIANVIAFTVSVINSFFWNNKYTFKNNNKNIKSILLSFIKVYISYALTGILLGNALLYIFIDLLNLSKYIAPFFGLFITIPLNFILNKKWAFKDKKERTMFEKMNKEQAAQKILESVKDYYNTYMQKPAYRDGDRISYASRVFDEREMMNLVDSSLEFWLTSGRYTDQFEKLLGEYLNIQYVSLVNSGSSANLIAFMALTSNLLGERAIKRGDEVITVAAGFPTTVTPILQYGAVPVFVDVTIPQYNIDVSALDKAISPKTKAVMLAHTLGNPFDLKTVKDFCKKNNLWLIEDNCDALGSKYTMDDITKFTGTIGDIGTSSFYPPHHMTMGEGGAVYTSDPLLHKIIRSMRDWGRDCACPSGKDNLCGHRFNVQFGELPAGYDHKYVYSHFGYNLKATDMQAAIGCAQLEKFPTFVEKRKYNWNRLYEGLKIMQDKLILPEAAPNSDPSWFGFLITCREGVNRNKLVQHIESKNIQTRMLFAGNLIKHPCFDEMRETGEGYRVVGNLEETDRIMNNSFWIGVYPGMTDEMLDKMINVISMKNAG